MPSLQSHRLELEQSVTIDRGVLAGLTGVLVEIRGDRCLIKVATKSQGVSLLVDAEAVTPSDPWTTP